MKARLAVTFLFFSILSTSNTTFASADNNAYSGWSWGVNVDELHISAEAANRADIQLDRTASAIGLSAEHFSSDSDMTYAFGFNVVEYQDNNPFYYDTSWGNYESSYAQSTMLYFEAGPRIRLGYDQMTFVTVKAGISSIIDSRRTTHCGCYSEDLALDGGLYGVVGAGYSFGSFDVALNFTQYFSGDLDNSVSLKLSTTF